jgi:hypothetical protein
MKKVVHVVLCGLLMFSLGQYLREEEEPSKSGELGEGE